MTRARKELYIFAFEDGSTSSFSREIFAPRASAAGSRGKGIGISRGSRQAYTYDMEEYKEGMYVLHKTFRAWSYPEKGRGQGHDRLSGSGGDEDDLSFCGTGKRSPAEITLLFK